MDRLSLSCQYHWSAYGGSPYASRVRSVACSSQADVPVDNNTPRPAPLGLPNFNRSPSWRHEVDRRVSPTVSVTTGRPNSATNLHLTSAVPCPHSLFSVLCSSMFSLLPQQHRRQPCPSHAQQPVADPRPPGLCSPRSVHSSSRPRATRSRFTPAATAFQRKRPATTSVLTTTSAMPVQNICCAFCWPA